MEWSKCFGGSLVDCTCLRFQGVNGNMAKSNSVFEADLHSWSSPSLKLVSKSNIS